MKAYIEKLRAERTPHERRQISMQVAGLMTALLFVGWLGTLGVRLASTPVAHQDNTSNAAAALVAVQGASSTSTMLPGYSGY
ncbi:MAG TPA: hypothetical protein VHD37_02940 [Candidatus Paceibacterota bacterium]|nr:hypothetical protein [Candidatus Paceibacterota bacterium]